MSKSNTFETDLLDLIFNATAIANIADNASTGPLGSLYLALHYDDPGEAGTQDANEASYPGYARQAVARTSGGFTVSGNSATLTADVDFPESTGAEPNGGGVLDFFSIGVAVSGATKVLYSGAVSPTITVSGTGITPRLTTGTTVTED